MIHKGTILQFCGSWGSGLGYLEIRDVKTGAIDSVPCDNGATVRALEAAFGNTVSEGHTANGNGYKGQEVYWSYDDMGLVLGGFTPVDNASPELEAAYNS